MRFRSSAHTHGHFPSDAAIARSSMIDLDVIFLSRVSPLIYPGIAFTAVRGATWLWQRTRVSTYVRPFYGSMLLSCPVLHAVRLHQLRSLRDSLLVNSVSLVNIEVVHHGLR